MLMRHKSLIANVAYQLRTEKYPYIRGRKIFHCFQLAENYFDEVSFTFAFTKWDSLEMWIRRLYNARTLAYEKYPPTSKDFRTENLRIAYLLWLYYVQFRFTSNETWVGFKTPGMAAEIESLKRKFQET